MRSFKRRDFLRTTLGLSLSAILPAATRESFAQERSNDDLIIESVDVIRVTGEMPSRGGMNRQHQTQPLHLYDRPEEYRDDPSVPVGTYTGQHDYVRIRTRSGLEGLYGYCDSDAAVNIVGPLKRQLIGRNLIALKDDTGKRFFAEFHEVVKSTQTTRAGQTYYDGSGWVQYRWPKPGEEVFSPKITYVKGCLMGDKNVYVGAGYYE